MPELARPCVQSSLFPIYDHGGQACERQAGGLCHTAACRYGARETGKTRPAEQGAGQMRQWAILATVLAAAACQSERISAPGNADLSAELIPLEGTRPPDGPPGACWDSDILPTIIETVTEQALVQPEVRGPDGSIVTAAIYRTESSQKIVQDRGQVWFRAPCLADLDVDFVATLQRALKARGFYLLPLTGVYDGPTKDAVRRYQATRGFDSPRLTLTAARELGIVAADLGLPAAD